MTDKVTMMRIKASLEVFVLCVGLMAGLFVIVHNDGVRGIMAIFLSATSLYLLISKVCEVLRA